MRFLRRTCAVGVFECVRCWFCLGRADQFARCRITATAADRNVNFNQHYDHTDTDNHRIDSDSLGLPFLEFRNKLAIGVRVKVCPITLEIFYEVLVIRFSAEHCGCACPQL